MKRDDEKEVERKARAKRARESRRSTTVQCTMNYLLILLSVYIVLWRSLLCWFLLVKHFNI